MIRLEIIANNSVERDIRSALKTIDDDLKATRLSAVHGWGNTDPKEGTAVWPEENFIYIIYTDDEKAREYIEAVREVKKKFQIEGIKLFALPYVKPVDL